MLRKWGCIYTLIPEGPVGIFLYQLVPREMVETSSVVDFVSKTLKRLKSLSKNMRGETVVGLHW